MRAALRFVFRRLVAIYFRDVEIAGDVPGPDTGGRIFAANHVNALVDPILVLTQAPCAISPVPLALIGMVLYWLPYQVPPSRRASIAPREDRLARLEALAIERALVMDVLVDARVRLDGA